jgi:hypothetical protein
VILPYHQSKHATDPFCNRPSWQIWPTPPKLPLWSPLSTTTSIPTLQTKYHQNVHKITAISESQRYPPLGLANHNWSLHPKRRFYGHSYLAPTPPITTIQSLGVSLTKAFAHHFRYASQKLIASPLGDQHYLRR